MPGSLKNELLEERETFPSSWSIIVLKSSSSMLISSSCMGGCNSTSPSNSFPGICSGTWTEDRIGDNHDQRG